MADVLLIGAEELENLSTRYLAAVLRRHGYSVELAAFSTIDDLQPVVALTRRVQPRLIGLSLIFQYRAPEFLALAAQLRLFLQATHITMGGHFPTFAAGALLRDYPVLDTIVRGEGEFTLLELMQQVDTPATWHTIDGLSYRDNGTVVENPARPLCHDLDALPFPIRDHPPQQYLGVGYTPILASRGCTCSCSFCSIRSFYGNSAGPPQRFRSVPNLVDEMEMLYSNFAVRFFVFNDDEWFPRGEARQARVDALGYELRRRQMDVIMSIKCRADDVEPEIFRQLVEIGVVRAYVGIESGSNRSLKAMNKRTTVAQNRQALKVIREVGMLADYGMIMFEPESQPDDIHANLDFMRAMGGEGEVALSFGRLEVYAGTPVLHRLQQQGRLTGTYMAWNYIILDPRIEILWRLVITTLRHRHFDSGGLGKRCITANYELMMFKHLQRQHYCPELGTRLRTIVAAVNNHSLDMLEEMFDFSLSANIYDTELVNRQAAEWARRANLFDMELEVQLNAWRETMANKIIFAR